MQKSIGMIVMACSLSCLAVWVQNAQIETSYTLREKENRLIELQTEERQLQARLAYLGSPSELIARLGSEKLTVHSDDTRWVLRQTRWDWEDRNHASRNPTLLTLAKASAHPVVRALALWVKSAQ